MSDTIDDAKSIVLELKKYDTSLYRKPRWLVINKADMLSDEINKEVCSKFINNLGWDDKVFVISALTGKGCKQLIYAIMEYLEQENKTEMI